MNWIGHLASKLCIIDGRIDCPHRVRRQAENALRNAENLLKMRYAGKRIEIVLAKGESIIIGKSGRSYWCKRSPDGKDWWGAYTIVINRKVQRIIWYTDPSGQETDYEATHEMGEAICASLGIEDSHALLKKAGIG